MTDGDRLMNEYSGMILTRKNAAALAMRIDGLIRIAVSAERHRCFDLVRDTMGAVLKPAHEQKEG